MKRIVISIAVVSLCTCVIIVAVFLFNGNEYVGTTENTTEVDGIQINYKDNDSGEGITQDVHLPQYNKSGNKITWQSSNDVYIDNRGKVHRPIGVDVSVDLTASVKVGSMNQSKKFSVVVLKQKDAGGIVDHSMEYLSGDAHHLDIERDESGKIVFIDGRFTDYKIKSSVDAIYSLNSIKAIMGFNAPENEFTVTKLDKDDHLIYYRLQQILHGIHVYGRQLVVCTDIEGNAVSVSGDYLPITSLDMEPKIPASRIVNELGRSEKKDIQSLELVVYPRKDHTVCLAWKIHILSHPLFGKPTDKFVFYNATTGDKIGETSLVIP